MGQKGPTPTTRAPENMSVSVPPAGAESWCPHQDPPTTIQPLNARSGGPTLGKGAGRPHPKKTVGEQPFPSATPTPSTRWAEHKEPTNGRRQVECTYNHDNVQHEEPRSDPSEEPRGDPNKPQPKLQGKQTRHNQRSKRNINKLQRSDGQKQGKLGATRQKTSTANQIDNTKAGEK